MSEAPRILHLFANYKWTGPADPAIRTAARLREQGHDAVFAQAGFVHAGGEHRMAEELWHRRVPVVVGLELRKHFHAGSILRDARRLRQLLARDRYDVLHCHLPADHLLAALAVRGASRPPIVVRSLYDPEPPPRRLRTWASLRATAGIVAPTAAVAGALQRRGFAAERILVQEPVTEPRDADGENLRAQLGIDPGAFAVGITARIQPHRRFDLLWDVARLVADRVPTARFVLLGRGNEVDTANLVHTPVRRLGLERTAVLPGYLREPAYSRALRGLDAFLFLVPGSDGTCRAVREALAFGLPVVATPRGMLPDLLRPATDGTAPGIVAAENAADLAAALLRLHGDAALRRRTAAAARSRACDDMDPVRAARALGAFYGRLLAAR